MLWTPGADAPRDVEALARYIDQRFGELSRALDTFKVFFEAYTPEWIHSDSTNPVIGNGTLIGHATRFGGMAHVQISLEIGSTTTFEAAASPGQWEFSVPWACEGQLTRYTGSALALDSGTEWHAGSTRIIDGASRMLAFFGTTSNGVRNNLPMTWATGDQLLLDMTYPVRD